MYYSSFGVLALVLHFIINADFIRKEVSKQYSLSRNIYGNFLNALAVYYVTDILWGILYENRLIFLTYIDTTCYFIAMALSVLLWTRFVVSFTKNTDRFGKILMISGLTIFILQLLCLIINPFIPVVFGFSETKEYMPGETRYISLILQMVLFIFTSIYTLVVASKSTGRHKAQNQTIGVSGLIMSVFILLQSLFPLLPFYAIGCLLATSIVHSFVTMDLISENNQEMEKTKMMALRDGLTGIRNKTAYLDVLKDLEMRVDDGRLKEYGVVVFDLNGLKAINDNFGHDTGDEYIKKASTLICKIYKHSPVFRIGGDEFVAILENDDYLNRESLKALFDQTIDDNRKANDVVVSSGMAIYDPDADRNYNDVFKRADKNMYERKEFLKSLE